MNFFHLTYEKKSFILKTMKAKTCKIKIKQLVVEFGGREDLAKKLFISERYVQYLENGRKPGSRLYRDICNLYNEIINIHDNH